MSTYKDTQLMEGKRGKKMFSIKYLSSFNGQKEEKLPQFIDYIYQIKRASYYV